MPRVEAQVRCPVRVMARHRPNCPGCLTGTAPRSAGIRPSIRRSVQFRIPEATGDLLLLAESYAMAASPRFW